MAGPTRSIQIDGHEINADPYTTRVPELNFQPEFDALMVPQDGDYPVIVRLQPREGRYTFLVQMYGGTAEQYDTRLAQLQGWFARGFHDFTFQVRGMSATKTLRACVVSTAAEFTERRFTAVAIAPRPELV